MTDRQTDRQTDGRTDRRNCDSICALSIYAVARKNSGTRSNAWMEPTNVQRLCSLLAYSCKIPLIALIASAVSLSVVRSPFVSTSNEYTGRHLNLARRQRSSYVINGNRNRILSSTMASITLECELIYHSRLLIRAAL